MLCWGMRLHAHYIGHTLTIYISNKVIPASILLYTQQLLDGIATTPTSPSGHERAERCIGVNRMVNYTPFPLIFTIGV